MKKFKEYKDFVNEHIEKEGNEWVIWSKDRSKKLGSYPSKKAALKRLRQIEYFKNKG